MRGWAWLADEDCREDVESRDLVDGGDGAVTFNWLQQHPEGFDPPRTPSPIEEGDGGTTDPWGVGDYV